MAFPRKRDFPVDQARRILEPGPIVLVTSAWKGEENVMTMGWHMVMEFTPSLVGCIIAGSNYSFDMIRKSGECVINVPTVDIANEVVKIGNNTGEEIDKFESFELTRAKASKVKAPLIRECFANFECKIYDESLIDKYNFFIFKIVKAYVASTPKYPKTLHYHGQGIFTADGRVINKARQFTKWKDLPVF